METIPLQALYLVDVVVGRDVALLLRKEYIRGNANSW